METFSKKTNNFRNLSDEGASQGEKFLTEVQLIDNNGIPVFNSVRRVRKGAPDSFKSSYAAMLFDRSKRKSSKRMSKKTLRAVIIAIIAITLPILLWEILYLNGIASGLNFGSNVESASFQENRNAIEESNGAVEQVKNQETNAAHTLQPITEITTVRSNEKPGNVPDKLKKYASNLVFVQKHYKVISNGAALNISSEPNQSSSKVGSASDGADIFVKYIYGDWAYVAHNGIEGWASLAYLA